MTRVVAYVYRFINYKSNNKSTYLQPEELLHAERKLFKNIQETHFAA